MMKETFLKDLEKKLTVLSKEEKQDIINEYSDIIDEKVKHGKTEEEAVNEFGDIKELSKEILKTYKINPEYNKSDLSEKTNEFIKNSEDFIKKGAKKLSDVTEDVVDNIKKGSNNFDSTQIFEIVIKVILVLIGLAILKIPFYIISGIGGGVFNIGSFPFSGVSSFAWHAIIEIIYLAICIIVVVSLISKYTKNNNNYEKKEEVKSTKSDSTELKKEDTINKKKQEVEYKSNDGVGNFLLLLVKIWCIILVLLPIWCIEMGLLAAVCVVVFLIIKGLSIYGVLVLLLGIMGIFIYFSDLIWKLLFSKKNIHIYPIFISMLLIFVGGIMTFDYCADLSYINKIPANIELTKVVYEDTISSDFTINYDYDKFIDNSLADNTIKIEVTYYDEIYDNVEIIKSLNGNEYFQIIEDYKEESSFWNNRIFDDVVTDLKDNKVFNYSLLDNVEVKIYTNELTSKLYE